MKKLLCLLLSHDYELKALSRTEEVQGDFRICAVTYACSRCGESFTRKESEIDREQFPGGAAQWLRTPPKP